MHDVGGFSNLKLLFAGGANNNFESCLVGGPNINLGVSLFDGAPSREKVEDRWLLAHPTLILGFILETSNERRMRAFFGTTLFEGGGHGTLDRIRDDKLKVRRNIVLRKRRWHNTYKDSTSVDGIDRQKLHSRLKLQGDMWDEET